MGLRRKSVETESVNEVLARLTEAAQHLNDQIKIFEETMNKSNRKMASMVQEMAKASERMKEQNRSYGPRGSRVWR